MCSAGTSELLYGFDRNERRKREHFPKKTSNLKRYFKFRLQMFDFFGFVGQDRVTKGLGKIFTVNWINEI